MPDKTPPFEIRFKLFSALLVLSTERQNWTVIFQSFTFPTRQPSGRQTNNSAVDLENTRSGAD
jgi:hypothetical protein